MMEEAHSFFVRSQVQNIEKHSRISEKPSQWLLERRAKEEFSPAYVSNGANGTVQVLALGDDAIGKLMGAWGSLLGNQSASLQNPDTTTPSTLLPDNSKEVLPPTEPSLPDIVEAEIVAEDIKDVKPQRLGRPRKYPKKSSQSTETPPIPPPLPTHLNYIPLSKKFQKTRSSP
jgi:hypothetical protein